MDCESVGIGCIRVVADVRRVKTFLERKKIVWAAGKIVFTG
jgi:hypothetical protein